MTDYIKRSVSGALILSFAVMALFRTVDHFAGNVTYPWYAHLISASAVLGTGILLSVLNDRYGLLPERTQWIIVTYVFLVSCFPQIYGNYKPALAAFLIAAATCKLVYSAYVPVTRSGPFLSAFFITCAGLLFFPAFFLYIPFIISYVRLAKVSGKDMVAFTAGIIVPFFLLLSGMWLLKGDMARLWPNAAENIHTFAPRDAFRSLHITQVVLLSYLALLVCDSFFIRLVRRDTTTTVTVSRFYGSMFWFLLFLTGVLIAYPPFAGGIAYLIMVPVSVLITSLFHERRFPGSKFWLLLLIMVSLAYYITRLLSLPY